MKKRVLSILVLLAIFVPLLIIGGIPFAIAVGIVGVLAYREINNLYNYPLIVKILGLISLITLVYSNFDSNMIPFGLDYGILGIIMIMLFIPVIFYQPKGTYCSADAFKLFGFIMLVGMGLNYFILYDNFSLKYFIFMLLIPIFTDTFAYIAGTMIGKHKVTPISPKKSWEGCFVGSAMSTFMMTMYYTTIINNQSNILIVIGIILLLTIVGQLGDLFFSAIKREHEIKDFSNIIPGHGGVLDRLDSLIFVAIAFMIFIEYL
jgi:phosphatidate cytidylyltransferase